MHTSLLIIELVLFKTSEENDGEKKSSQVTIPMDFFKPLINAWHVVLMVARKNPNFVPFFVLRQAYVASIK